MFNRSLVPNRKGICENFFRVTEAVICSTREKQDIIQMFEGKKGAPNYEGPLDQFINVQVFDIPEISSIENMILFSKLDKAVEFLETVAHLREKEGLNCSTSFVEDYVKSLKQVQ